MKNYSLSETKDKNLFRLVDRNGDWQHYFYKPKKQYLRSVNAILDRGFAKGQRFYSYLLDTTREKAEEVLKSAGDRGDAVHQFISLALEYGGELERGEVDILDPETRSPRHLNLNEWDYVLPFENFIALHKPILVANEFPAYNLKFGYAGTADAAMILTAECGLKKCECKKYLNRVGIWDWKTSASIYESYGPQLAAYGNGQNIKKLGVKPEYTAVLQVGAKRATGGWNTEFYGKEETKKHWQEFLAAIEIDNATYKPFDPEKEIYEMRDSVIISVGKLNQSKNKIN